MLKHAANSANSPGNMGSLFLIAGLFAIGIYVLGQISSKEESYSYPLSNTSPLELDGYDPTANNTNIANTAVPRFDILNNPHVKKPSLTSFDIVQSLDLNDKFRKQRQSLTSQYRESFDIVRKPMRNMMLSAMDPDHSPQAKIHVVIRHAETQSVLVDVIPNGMYTLPVKIPFDSNNPLYIQSGSAPVIMDVYIGGVPDVVLYYEALDDVDTPQNIMLEPYTIRVTPSIYILVRNGAIDTIVNGIMV